MTPEHAHLENRRIAQRLSAISATLADRSEALNHLAMLNTSIGPSADLLKSDLRGLIQTIVETADRCQKTSDKLEERDVALHIRSRTSDEADNAGDHDHDVGPTR